MKNTAGKQKILSDLEKRVNDKILEQSNFDLLKKLVKNADTLDEAIIIAELGTTYKRTGFHFNKRLEKQSNTIFYFKRNDALSFVTDPKALTHKLIIGDNYPALLNLLIEYKGGIDVIYIDPPYGKDGMGTFAQTNYDNALTRDNLLSMLYPRLWIAKQLLSESGVIFCSIDDRNQAYVKCLFDEVFGESNFVTQFVWKKKGGSGNTEKIIGNLVEYILCYAKCQKPGIFNYRTLDRKYRFSDDIGQYNLEGIEKTNEGSYERKTMMFPIIDPQTGKEFLPQKGKRWTIGENTVKEFLQLGKLYFDYDKLLVKRIKRPADYELSKNVYYNLLLEHGSLATAKNELERIIGQRELFDTPKPVKLINSLLEIASKPSAVILDFFAGSGTTGHAVLELNATDGGDRQFLLCTNNENGIAVDVTSKRLKRVMTGQCYGGNSDFDWIKKHKPLGGNLEVLDIVEVANFETVAGKTPFDVIDETLYGQEKFKTVKQKVGWVCNHFEGTRRRLEEE